MKKDYIIITNNPLVPQMLDEEHEVDYSEISYEDVLGTRRTFAFITSIIWKREAE